MLIKDVPEGTTVRIACTNEPVVVLGHGPMGTRVRPAKPRHVTISRDAGEDPVTVRFESTAPARIISPSTPVTPTETR